ncbi:AMP-binding protein [Bradyrhizobium sp. USDA 4469]
MLETMAAMIARNAALSARQPAVWFEGRWSTHSEFALRAWSLANAVLGPLGQARGSRLAVLSQNRIEYLEVYAAAEAAGLVAVTVNWRLAAPEIALVLDDAEPAILFLEDRFITLFEQARQHMRKAPPQTVVFGGEYESLVNHGDAAKPDAPEPDDIAHIIYTSGTTGAPKGVMLSQRALASSAFTIALTGGHRPGDRMLVSMPLFHSGAKIELSSVQAMGGSCVLMRQFDPVAVFDVIFRQQVTLAHLAPAMVKVLVEHPGRAEHDLRSLRQINYGSAPVPAEELRRATTAFGPIFTQFYGMTENVLISALLPSHASVDGPEAERLRLSSAGQPHPGTQIRICDESGADAALGEIGEIVIRSPSMMSGYWRNPTLTSEALAGGWMHSGDMGRLDKDGFLYVVDRKKDMIVTGGENVYSREVEDALLAHTAVADVAVIGIPHPRWGEAVTAFVILQPGVTTDADELISHCRTLIAGYKRPQSIMFVDAFPRLPHGKVDKKALRALHWAGRDRNVA